MNVNILIMVLILCWTFNPLIKKICSSGNNKKLNNNESLVLNHVLVTIILIIYTVYLIKYKRCNLQNIKNLEFRDFMIYLIGAVFTLLSSACLYEILQYKQMGEIVPIVQPSVIVLSLFMGYLVFNENITMLKILGTTLVATGVYLITKK